MWIVPPPNCSEVISDVIAQLRMSGLPPTKRTAFRSNPPGADGGAGAGAGAGAGGGSGVGCAAGCGLCSTSVPCTGPKQVVPEYGMRSVLPLSSIVPTPLSEKAHGRPDRLAVPEIASCTVEPFNCPEALPEIFRLLPHCAVKVPLIELGVCDAIWYWKWPQELGLGSCTSFDTHMPTIDGPPAGRPHAADAAP